MASKSCRLNDAEGQVAGDPLGVGPAGEPAEVGFPGGLQRG